MGKRLGYDFPCIRLVFGKNSRKRIIGDFDPATWLLNPLTLKVFAIFMDDNLRDLAFRDCKINCVKG